MDGLSAISGYGSMVGLSSAGLAGASSQVAASPAKSSGAAVADTAVGASGAAGSTTVMASLQQSSESLLIANQSTAAPVSNELLGAILLMLLLKYLESSDTNEQKGLLSLMGSLAQAQQAGQSQSSSVMMYSSSSFSIDTLAMQTGSFAAATNAYSNTAVAPSGGSNGSGGSFNVMA